MLNAPAAEVARIPIIKLYDVLIVSVQVALSDPIIIRLKDDVASRIENTNARALALDVSGIDLMDSYISRVIRDIGLTAKLMGVRTVVCGIDPMIAMALVDMGMGLEGVTTALNLESALRALGLVVVQEVDDSWDDEDDAS